VCAWTARIAPAQASHLQGARRAARRILPISCAASLVLPTSRMRCGSSAHVHDLTLQSASQVAPEPGPASYAYSSSSGAQASGNSQTAIIAGSVVSALVVAAIVAVVVFCMLVLRRRRNSSGASRLDESTSASSISLNHDNNTDNATGAPARFI
jgi:hypothetical protein